MYDMNEIIMDNINYLINIFFYNEDETILNNKCDINYLPNEMIIHIFDNITLITDKRQFLKTCSLYNKITKQSMLKFESNYKVKCFGKINEYGVEKFTLEICHDKYFDMIPERYIIPTNNMIVEALSSFYTIPLESYDSVIFFNKIPLTEIITNTSVTANYICSLAAYYGNFGMLKWLIKQKCAWFKTSLMLAKQGRLEILKWARENGCEWDQRTCSEAARYGHFELLKWALENGCVWDDKMFLNAAEGGHLDMLKWILPRCKFSKKSTENKKLSVFKWGPLLCSNAALNGHLDVLKWAIENGCKWDNQTCINAEKNGHLELLKWAIDNGCPH